MAKQDANVKEREQAREEKVIETVSKTDQFFRENKKTIYGVLIALVVIALGVIAYQKFYAQPKGEEAAAQMFPAEANFRNGEFELALNGDGNVLGFAQIINDFGAKGGKDVYFYAGVCELQLGNYQEAINYLKKYNGKDAILQPAPPLASETPMWDWRSTARLWAISRRPPRQPTTCSPPPTFSRPE